MPTRRKSPTVKKVLKTPPSITPLKESGLPESGASLSADTQMPESQPFEVKVEVESQEPPAGETVAQSSRSDQPQPQSASASDNVPAEKPVEVQPQNPMVENNPIPSNLSLQEKTQGSGIGKKIVWLVILAAVLLFVAGGIYTYVKSMRSLNAPTPTPTPSETESTPSPTASPSAQLNRSDLKLQVLNGTSVVGLAAKAKTYLTGVGYKDITVGNADQSDLTETTIAIKDSKKGYLDLLTKDLNPKYPLAASPKSLDPSSPYDAVVTLGQP